MREQNNDVLYTTRVLRLITDDLLRGDPVPMMAALDYLMNERGHTLPRLLKFGRRSLGFTPSAMIDALKAVYGKLPTKSEVAFH